MGLKIAEVPPFQIQRGILTASCRISETFERQAASEHCLSKIQKADDIYNIPVSRSVIVGRQGSHERVCIKEFRKQLDHSAFGLQEGARALNAWFTRD